MKCSVCKIEICEKCDPPYFYLCKNQHGFCFDCAFDSGACCIICEKKLQVCDFEPKNEDKANLRKLEIGYNKITKLEFCKHWVMTDGFQTQPCHENTTFASSAVLQEDNHLKKQSADCKNEPASPSGIAHNFSWKDIFGKQAKLSFCNKSQSCRKNSSSFGKLETKTGTKTFTPVQLNYNKDSNDMLSKKQKEYIEKVYKKIDQKRDAINSRKELKKLEKNQIPFHK